MQFITGIDSFQWENRTAVTLGKFDGMHRGHQRLVERIRQYAGPDCASVLCAFEFEKDSLMTKEERRDYLEGKIDYLVEYPFTEELRTMSAEDFIKEILHKKLHVSHLVVGTDFVFGYQKRGDCSMLEKYAQTYGYTLDIVEKECFEGKEISSTFIREALSIGNIALAEKLLGHPYEMTGIVERGKQLGRTLGFPTMNLVPGGRKQMPRYGVYTCMVFVDGTWYPAVGNAGIKPTVTDERRRLLELYVYGYNGDAYGKTITARFCEFERPEMKFGSLEELQRQVMQDMQFGKSYFESRSFEIGTLH